jgi:hypothetical protein
MPVFSYSSAHYATVPPEPIHSVPRLVIPAKAEIQPGFRLALRLAGMTIGPANTQPGPGQLGSRTRCKIADAKLRFRLCCLLLESADALSGFPYAGLFLHPDDAPPGEDAGPSFHACFDE